MSSSEPDAITVTIDGVVADWMDDDPRTFTRGTSITPTLTFVGYRDETLPDPTERHAALAEYLEYDISGFLYRGTTDEGEPWFREDVPDFHPVDSYLVSVEYGAGIETERHAWALIVGGENVTPSSTGPFHQLDLELFILAELGEYPDEAAVREAFEEPAF